VLLDNAAKYSPAGGEISIAVSAEGSRVRVAVGDGGSGLPELDRKFLLSAFFPGALADRPRGSGVGHGLALARQLIERQGGEIGLSDTSDGTVVYLTLTRAERKSSAANGPARTTQT